MSRIRIVNLGLLEQVGVSIKQSPDHQCGDRGKDHGCPRRKIGAVAGPLQKLKKACHQKQCKPFGSGSARWQIPVLFASPHRRKTALRFKLFRFISAKRFSGLVVFARVLDLGDAHARGALACEAQQFIAGDFVAQLLGNQGRSVGTHSLEHLLSQ